MPDDRETLFIECDRDAAASIADGISRAGGGRAQISERRNLDGLAMASAAVIATLAVQTLPHVLNFLLELIKTRRVTSIRIGDIEVQNPGAEDLRVMRQELERRIAKGKRSK